MKNIILVVLALVAMPLGCEVGNPVYCHHVTEMGYTYYGGPYGNVRDLLRNPCGGTRITEFRSGPDYSFYLDCRDIKVAYYLYPHSMNVITYYGKEYEDKVTLSGYKAEQAWKLARIAANYIAAHSGDIGWNP
jgi:hypothetical protein